MKLSFWLKDPKTGQRSVSLTFLTWAFVLCVFVWLPLSMFEEIAGVAIRDFNGTTAMEVLTPFALLYFGRKFTDVRAPQKDENGKQEGA